MQEAQRIGNPDLIVTVGGDGTFLRGVRAGGAWMRDMRQRLRYRPISPIQDRPISVSELKDVSVQRY